MCLTDPDKVQKKFEDFISTYQMSKIQEMISNSGDESAKDSYSFNRLTNYHCVVVYDIAIMRMVSFFLPAHVLFTAFSCAPKHSTTGPTHNGYLNNNTYNIRRLL
jgi:hypothetical protein